MKYTKQMGLTHADFFRLLPRAMGENTFEVNGHEVQANLATGSLNISLGEQRERKLSAHVVMPYADVTFDFNGVPEEVRLAFEQHFNLRFMRGLG
ncbi:MAG: hypothetical protein KTR32_10295 [Granulosicoccus sp.]|nr:hypothetical protein [Granulosicoccus sp.]